MATLRTKDINRSLLTKGFEFRESDHKRYVLVYNGRRTSISTYISHGAREISDYLINRMSIELKLERNEFTALVDCHLDKDGYIDLLRNKHVLQPIGQPST